MEPLDSCFHPMSRFSRISLLEMGIHSLFFYDPAVTGVNPVKLFVFILENQIFGMFGMKDRLEVVA